MSATGDSELSLTRIASNTSLVPGSPLLEAVFGGLEETRWETSIPWHDHDTSVQVLEFCFSDDFFDVLRMDFEVHVMVCRFQSETVITSRTLNPKTRAAKWSATNGLEPHRNITPNNTVNQGTPGSMWRPGTHARRSPLT